MEKEKVIRPDVNELAKQAHANAVKHGFWADSPSVEHLLCLVVCELAEAVEADRKGNKADRSCFSAMLCTWQKADQQQDPEQYAYEYKSAFDINIKDTVGDELADAVIRLLDLAGGTNSQLSSWGAGCMCMVNPKHTFADNIWQFISGFIKCDLSLPAKISSAIVGLEVMSEVYDIDLWWHVRMKMYYNGLRPYKHGKRY